jgi:putative photosynthetic complex assembly protein 2
MGLMLVLYVVAAWWGSTGLILYLGRRPSSTFMPMLAVAGALVVLAAVLLQRSSHSASSGGVCLAFGAVLMIWGWVELSFLLGAITGPRRVACISGCRGARHLLHAVEAILYHELATIVAAGLVIALSWRAPNLTGLWTFLMLWGMRISAKLNLFLGVPNTGEIMLPPHLQYLAAFFRRRRLNLLFPVSVAMAMLLCVLLTMAAWNAPSWDFAACELTLLATLAALASFEHWMLVLPMRADAPWKLNRTAAVRAAADG